VEDKATEVWRPGEVSITKITKGFPYLVVPGFAPPPPQDIPPNTLAAALLVESTDGPRPISKLSRRWARRLKRRKELKASKMLEANAIEEAITQAMLDSGASKTFVNSRRGMQRTGLFNKVVVTADGTEHPASHTVLLPTQALSKGAREAIVVPGMQQKALLSVGTLADNRYTTVFLPGQQGVQIYGADDINISPNAPPSLQGWRDTRGLWMVPIADSPSTNIVESANSVYELPSTKEITGVNSATNRLASRRNTYGRVTVNMEKLMMRTLAG
jgi:hypothetical protein